MLDAPRLPSRRRFWAIRLMALLFSIALTEALLRGAFMLRVHYGDAPGFGTQPEMLPRLFYAYHGGRYSMLPIGSRMTLPDPHRGYRLAPNLRNQPVGGTVTSTNSRGMRGEPEYSMPKPSSVVRVVALGDSLTFGDGVEDDATWPAQLENASSSMEVLNLGVGGYAHDQMYFALRDDGMPLQPDAVILGFYENDVWRDTLTYYAYEKPRFSLGREGWYVENQPVPTPEELRNYYLLVPLLYAVPRVLLESLLTRTTGVEGGDERAREILRRTQQLAEESGARFLIVNLPDLQGVDHPGPSQSHSGFFDEYCSTAAVECVDPLPEFWAAAGTDDGEEIRRRYLRPRDIHYSRAGYAIVAEVLRKHFLQHPIASTNVNRPVR